MSDAIKASYKISEKYYLLKSKFIGEKLYEWDRYNDIYSLTSEKVSWDETKESVLNSFKKFSITFYNIALKFFEKKWIDYKTKQGKRGGAYCAYISNSLHPYVFMNFTGEQSESTTLAHELGHAIHGVLSKNNRIRIVRADQEIGKGKIIELRSDVTNIKNQFEMGVIFLKMVGKYMELLTDVARDTGKAFVHKGNKYIEAAQNYEEKLRAEAEKIDNNQAIIEKLDKAKSDITEAKSNVDKAEASYGQVVLPGTPLIKFAEGNNYMRTARTNLISAISNLNSAYTLMIAGGA